jgi:hypothetical protein
MFDGKRFGRTAAGLEPHDRQAFRSSQVRAAVASCKAREKELTSKLDLL